VNSLDAEFDKIAHDDVRWWREGSPAAFVKAKDVTQGQS